MTTELQIIGSRDVLGQTVNAYGDFENPLFLAKDVADWIEHFDAPSMLRSIDDDEKVKIKTPPAYCAGGLQANTEYWFLTEDGLYEVFFLSRKPRAKEFKKGVKALLRDLRTGRKKFVEGHIHVEGKRIPIPFGKEISAVSINYLGSVTVKFREKSATEKRPRKASAADPDDEEYAADSTEGLIQRFIQERCVFAPNCRVSSRELYTEWKRWAKKNVHIMVFCSILSRVLQTHFRHEEFQRCFMRLRSHLYRGWHGLQIGSATELPVPSPALPGVE